MAATNRPHALPAGHRKQAFPEHPPDQKPCPVPQEPRNQTARTQPFPRGDSFVPTCPEPGSVAPGTKSSCVFGAFWEDPVVMTPGTLGGSSWAPMTFSPLTHLLYIPGSIINSAFSFHRQEWDSATKRLRSQGRGMGFMHPPGEPRAGTLTAINPATGKIVWQKRMHYPIGSGSGLLSTLPVFSSTANPMAASSPMPSAMARSSAPSRPALARMLPPSPMKPPASSTSRSSPAGTPIIAPRAAILSGLSNSAAPCRPPPLPPHLPTVCPNDASPAGNPAAADATGQTAPHGSQTTAAPRLSAIEPRPRSYASSGAEPPPWPGM